MKQRPKAALVVATLAGLLVGLSGDWLAGDIHVEFSDVIVAVLLSPILATVGGRAVTAPFPTLWLVGGLLFVPCWVILARRWLSHRTISALIVITLWSAQGFYQPMHRLAMVLSA